MKFEVELLTKNISIVKLDKLLLSSEIICVTSDSQIELGDENVMGDSDKYQCTLEGADFAIDVRQFRGGLVTILLRYEYSKSKLSSAKKFDKFLSKFREFLEKNDLNYSILSNSLSMYFSNRLYPTFQVYESLLRKILVLALSPLELAYVAASSGEDKEKCDELAELDTKEFNIAWLNHKGWNGEAIVERIERMIADEKKVN